MYINYIYILGMYTKHQITKVNNKNIYSVTSSFSASGDRVAIINSSAHTRLMEFLKLVV